MRSWLHGALDVLFYTNLWIAFAALCTCWQTYFVLTGRVPHTEPLPWVVFCATLVVYALHREVGLRKVGGFSERGRYAVIRRLRSWIWASGSIALVVGGVLAFQLEWAIWVAVLLPAVLTLGYVVPFAGGGRRLRDFDAVKIFVLSLVWAGVSVGLPALQLQQGGWAVVLLAVERAAFIFLLALSFDVRDLAIDGSMQVRTLPALLGTEGTRYAGAVAASLVVVSSTVLWLIGSVTIGYVAAIMLTAVLALLALWWAHPYRHDYYYTGWVDGLMIVMLGLVVWWG